MFSFACMEQNIRCFISSTSTNQRLGSNSDGTIFMTGSREDCERWIMILSSDNESIFFQSMIHGHYLTSNADGKLEATSDLSQEGAKWSIKRSPFDAHYTIRSSAYGKDLFCDKSGIICSSFDRNNSNWSKWDIELETGELCFITSLKYDKSLRCEPSGKTSLTESSRGWEVWRFIEAGEGYVLISSWTHDSNFLCSDAKGKVYTTKDRQERYALWSVESSPDSRGVILRSREHKKLLFTDGKILYTTNNEINGIETGGLWCTECACSQTYFISATYYDEQISSKPNKAFTTKNRKKWEKWKIEKSNEYGSFTIYSIAHGKFLGSHKNEKITMNMHIGKDELWQIEVSPHGGYFLISREHNKVLTCSSDGELSTIVGHRGGWETWSLDPCLPRSMTGEHMNIYTTLGVSSAIGLGLTVGMPFITMGVVGALGFTPGGIMAGSTAANMAMAGALGTGGPFAGGAISTLQSIGVCGLGIGGTSIAVGTGAICGGAIVGGTYAAVGGNATLLHMLKEKKVEAKEIEMPMDWNGYRPFCEWKNWLSENKFHPNPQMGMLHDR